MRLGVLIAVLLLCSTSAHGVVGPDRLLAFEQSGRTGGSPPTPEVLATVKKEAFLPGVGHIYVEAKLDAWYGRGGIFNKPVVHASMWQKNDTLKGWCGVGIVSLRDAAGKVLDLFAFNSQCVNPKGPDTNFHERVRGPTTQDWPVDPAVNLRAVTSIEVQVVKTSKSFSVADLVTRAKKAADAIATFIELVAVAGG